MLLALILGLTAQASSTTTTLVRHLEYKFAYDTTLSRGGPSTGTLSVDILGLATDGGMLVNARDWWWNASLPRQGAQCEVYPNGGVSCMQAPYLLPPMQLVLFPLLARDFFNGVSATVTSPWRQSYNVVQSVYTWASVFDLQLDEIVDNHFALVTYHGTSLQQGGRYRKSVVDGYVEYDEQAKVPVVVRDVRTYYPTGSAFSQDSVELQLTKDSLAKS